MSMGAPLTIPRRLLTVEQYHKMAEAGVFHEDDRIELIEGEIIEMAPIGPAHVAKVNQLCSLFVRAVADSAIVSIQNPVSLPPDNEPQPDVALLRPRADRYKTGLAGAQDVILLVEVADTNLDYDRDVKIPIYARHGIPEVWLLDVRAETFSIHLDPGPKGYGRLLTPGRNDTVAPSLLPNAPIRLADFW